MAIPKRETLRLEILKHISDNKEHTPKKTQEYLASEIFHLSDSERNEMQASGGEPIFANRVRWAIVDLRRAVLLKDKAPRSGIFKITERGLQVLEQNPPKIDIKFLLQFPEFKEWVKPSAAMRIEEKETGKKIKLEPGVIVLLDALGTKGIWKNSKKEVSEKWNQFITNFEHHVEKTLESYELKLDDFHTFSDTIMIIVKTSKQNDALIALALALHTQLIKSMLINRPLRGCITIGNFFYKNKLIIGPAIDEAAEYHIMPQWVGISASPTTNRIIEESNDTRIEANFSKCNIPLKESIEQNAWALRWIDYSDEIISKDSKKWTKVQFNNTRDFINARLKEITDISAAMKWRNTLKFYESRFNVEL